MQVAALMAVLKAARALGLVDALDEVRCCTIAWQARCWCTLRPESHLSLHALQFLLCRDSLGKVLPGVQGRQ